MWQCHNVCLCNVRPRCVRSQDAFLVVSKSPAKFRHQCSSVWQPHYFPFARKLRKKWDVRHEAEPGVHAQSVSLAHISWVYESLLSRAVVSGLVISLFLPKRSQRFSKCEPPLPVAPLKHDLTELAPTIVRTSPFWKASSPGFGFLRCPFVTHWVPVAQLICRSGDTL